MNLGKALGTLLVISGLLAFGMVNDATTPDNPFEEDPIVVNVTYGEPMPEYTSQVNQSVKYWNEHDTQYGNWTGNLSFQPQAEQADITIKFVQEINQCGKMELSRSVTTGCADIIKAYHTYDHHTVEVVGKRPLDSVERTVKHELGHVFGLEHGDSPMPLMDGEVERST